MCDIPERKERRKMERLFTSWQLKDVKIRNRICVPPMVCFGWSDDSGQVTEKNVNHYRAIAKGGAGLIIQGEAEPGAAWNLG